MARNTAYRTVNVKGLGATKIVATNDGVYTHLHWFTADGPILEVINNYDYRTGKLMDVNVSASLTEWLKEHNAEELATYYRNTV